MAAVANENPNQPPSWAAAPSPSSATTDNDKDTKATKATVDVNNDDFEQYHPSSTLSCPPLIQLQAYGLCCPFIETEEEHDARVCVTHLQNYPITWYRKKLIEEVAKDIQNATGASSTSGIMNGIGQLLGTNAKKQEVPMTYVGVPAILSIVDTDSHGPVIEIRTLEVNDPNNTAAKEVLNNYITSRKPWWEDALIKDKKPSKVLPLYMVDKVASGWSITNDQTAGGVKLYAAPPSKGFLSGFGPELLRFDTLGGGGNTLSDAMPWTSTVNEPNKYSDKVIVQLKSLVDWNRRRMARDIKKGKMSVVPKSDKTAGYVAIT